MKGPHPFQEFTYRRKFPSVTFFGFLIFMLLHFVLSNQVGAFEVRRLDQLPGGKIEKVVLGEPAFSHATTGYVRKQLRDSIDFPFVSDIDEIHLTTKKTIDEIGTATAVIHRKANDPEATRRKPLTILNYSSIAIKDNKLYLFNIPSRGLMIQFVLSLKYHYKEKYEKDITLVPDFDGGNDHLDDASIENYLRLSTCINGQSVIDKNKIDSLVFGYKGEIDDVWTELGAPSIPITDCEGWEGTAYENDDEDYIMVLDSDINHSYHVEVLARNIDVLLNIKSAPNLKNVAVAGSAGYIGDGNIEQNRFIYPDIKIDAETTVANTMKQIQDGVGFHTSVPSVLSESKEALDELRAAGITSVDMEFAYVAEILRRHNLEGAGIKLRVACLVTDFPYRAPPGKRLATKDKKAKTEVIKAYAAQLATELGLDTE